MDVCHSAFNAILHSIEEGGIQAHTWTFLATLFGDEMVKSTREMLSKETITLVIAQKSKRFIWTITSPKNLNYVWMNNSLFFCSCPSFYFRTLNGGKSPFCKHILAAYICDALNKNGGQNKPFKVTEIDDKDFAVLLGKAMVASEEKDMST